MGRPPSRSRLRFPCAGGGLEDDPRRPHRWTTTTWMRYLQALREQLNASPPGAAGADQWGAHPGGFVTAGRAAVALLPPPRELIAGRTTSRTLCVASWTRLFRSGFCLSVSSFSYRLLSARRLPGFLPCVLFLAALDSASGRTRCESPCPFWDAACASGDPAIFNADAGPSCPPAVVQQFDPVDVLRGCSEVVLGCFPAPVDFSLLHVVACPCGDPLFDALHVDFWPCCSHEDGFDGVAHFFSPSHYVGA